MKIKKFYLSFSLFCLLLIIPVYSFGYNPNSLGNELADLKYTFLSFVVTLILLGIPLVFIVRRKKKNSELKKKPRKKNKRK